MTEQPVTAVESDVAPLPAPDDLEAVEEQRDDRELTDLDDLAQADA